MEPTSTHHRGLHRFAIVLVCCVILLISAGALVTSTESGLSVPDWPLSYGSLNPPSWWTISTVRAEHGHRLIAGTVATLTVILAVWIGVRENRRWVRRLAYLAVATVLSQALLGGLTVLFFLPTPVSVAHASLAEVFLCLTVTLAVVTSRWWRRAEGEPATVPGARRLFDVARVTTGLVFFQIFLGAVMRHSGAGLAIPDFPLVFGGLIPPAFDFPIAIHYSHRLGALAVTAAVVVTLVRALRLPSAAAGLRAVAVGLATLVAIQISLGAAVVLTGKAVVPNTAHVATGATILATSLLLTLGSWRSARAAVPSSAGAVRDPAFEGTGAQSASRATAQPNPSGGG